MRPLDQVGQVRQVRLVVLSCALAVLAGAPARADWLVYLGGGVTEIEGTWELRGRQVVFRAPGGTLMSARADDVDLPASAFLTWQVGDRRRSPGGDRSGAPAAAPAPDAAAPAAGPCLAARMRRTVSAEAIEVEIAGAAEIVHPTCVDAPETDHRFPEIAGYGSLAAQAIESRAPAGARLCLIEETPPRRDRSGHRILYLKIGERGEEGDLGAELVGGGFGLARRGECGLGTSYVELERQARGGERGLWGPAASAGALAVTARAGTSSAPPPPRRSARS